MKTFNRFYNMKVGIIDLRNLVVENIPVGDDILSERIGGAAVNMALFDRYAQDDPIVLGVGPLTGSFAPASCLMAATFRSPKSGMMTHVPFTVRTGPEMKFAGFDYLVILGSAEQPRTVYFTEGKAEFLPAGRMTGLRISESMRILKGERRYARSVVLTGPAADKGLPFAAASIGTGGSLDKAGLGSLMAAKNLKGFMFHGIEGLPFGENNLSLSDEMIKSLNKADRGFLSVLKKIGAGDAVTGSLRNYRTKHMACYHCPSPCMSHVTAAVPQAFRGEGSQESAGVFLLDHLGYAALASKGIADVMPVMSSCLQLGIDPLAVSGKLPDSGTAVDMIAALEIMIEEAKTGGEDTGAADGEISSGVPQDDMNRFGGGLAPLLIHDEENPVDSWRERVAAAMILGVCPLFVTRFPETGADKLLAYMTGGEDEAESVRESLAASVRLVCGS